MAIGELRALPVGRGQIGKVKYIPAGLQGRGGRSIPPNVIKTGVKLPEIETGKQKVWNKLYISESDSFFYLFIPSILSPLTSG